MERVWVLYNEKAGRGRSPILAKEFFEHAKHQPEIKEVFLRPLDSPAVRTYPEKALQENIDTLIIIGGDGSIHYTVELFKDSIHQYQIGIIPGGTVNNLARALTIPLDDREAIKTIFSGRIHPIDYGKTTNGVILSSMTIGIFADAAKEVTQKEKQRYGPWVFVRNFFRVLKKKKSYPVTIETPNDFWSGKMELLVITMSNSVAGFTNFDSSAAIDDGLLHVTILPKNHWYSIFWHIFRVFSGKIYQLDSVKYLSADQITITSDQSIVTRTDGEPTGNLPVEVHVQKRALNIIVPKDGEG